MSKLKPAVSAADHQLGNTQAPVTLVEFGDFECPHCGRAHTLVQRLLKEKGDAIQFVFRHFPLQEIHPNAYPAALAAEAAGRQDKFWPMHDLIFENQQRLSTSLFPDLATGLKLDLKAFGTDWKAEEIQGKVEQDFESGVRSGVNGTPTFFINGMPVLTYDETYESLLDAVEAKIRG